jgi:hypothetical protein
LITEEQAHIVRLKSCHLEFSMKKRIRTKPVKVVNKNSKVDSLLSSMPGATDGYSLYLLRIFRGRYRKTPPA